MTQEQVQGFLDFERDQKKSIRGGIEMYDVKGCHKYLSLSELLDYYLTYKQNQLTV
jgi:hypothetical protein